MSFDSLGLPAALLTAARALGFESPTPIQSAAIPVVLGGADLRACAQTGSGKTAAYGLPVLQRLIEGNAGRFGAARTRGPYALVLVPTRELALQVGTVLRDLARHLPQRLRIHVVFGGESINPQMMGLRGGADLVVATPGRLIDLVEHRALALSEVQTLVLDEADRLLDLGFAEELQRVLGLLPARRQNLLFSATYSPAVVRLAEGLLHRPVVIEIAQTPETVPDIAQRAIAVDTTRRTALLRHLIETHEWSRVLVFVATQYAAELVAEKLYRQGVYATAFHGGLSQGARTRVLDEFKDERWEVVVATDLSARGIDISDLPVVVNYDLPRAVADYVHRIGRTGRAGESGLAVSFVTAPTAAHWRLIAKRQRLDIPLETLEGFEPTEEAVPASPVPGAEDGNGGIKGKRPSKKDRLRAAAAEDAKRREADGSAVPDPRTRS